MRINILKVSLIIAFCSMSTLLFAQDPSGTPGGGVQLDVPLDGGLSLLVAAGLLYGERNRQRLKKNKK
jgi:hypothetical protein